MSTSTQALQAVRGGLIVSCQAYPGEPMRNAETMAQMAEAAARGGAVGIRAQGLDDVELIAKRVHLPLIGLVKRGTDGVFITPTASDAMAVIRAGAGIVALDGTRRPRPDGLTLAETVARIRGESSALIMADVGSFADAVAAVDAGVDVVGTTLAGYTVEREKTPGPDLELLHEIVQHVSVPVFAEGRIHTPQQAHAAIEIGAWAVVVGTAITHPTTITSWFAQSLAHAGSGSAER